jgi:hypothetical protein
MSTQQQPTLETNVNLRFGRVGFPKRAKASLFTDRVELAKTNGEAIATIPLGEIPSVGNVGGCLQINHNDKMYALDFMNTFAKMFGLVGMLLDRKGRANSKAWVTQLTASGVQIKKKLF